MRTGAPAWDEALRHGKESVVCALPEEAAFVRAAVRPSRRCARGLSPRRRRSPGRRAGRPPGLGGVLLDHRLRRTARTPRAGHDLNYLGWAGTLEDTAPGLPPVQVADLAAGALTAVAEVLAALLRRGRTGVGGHVVVSMTHASHDLVAHRLGGDPLPRQLTGGLACYRVYATADERWPTVAALEPRFFGRLCEVAGWPELAPLQYQSEQAALAAELANRFRRRPLADWLALFDGEDVCVGPSGHGRKRLRSSVRRRAAATHRSGPIPSNGVASSVYAA